MNFYDYQKSIEEHFKNNGYKLDPLPKVECITDDNNLLDPFIDTGNFNATENKITLYVGNRQLKDILRTLCHEYAHVHQFHTDPEKFKKADTDLDNQITKELESEAYSIGNLMLRTWTDENNPMIQHLNESAYKPFKNTTVVICAAMRPPHKGHLEMIEEYAKQADKVVVILSNPKSDAGQRKTIDGKTITAETSKKILELYLKKYSLEDKVEIIISSEPSPVKSAASYINAELTNTNVILGMSKKDDPYSRYSGIKEYFKDRDDIYIFEPDSTAVKTKSNISATEIRDHINDYDYIKDMFPDKLTDDEKQNLINLIKGNSGDQIEESDSTKILSEGKHWPEDYVKTAKNTILNSDLGKASWYSEKAIESDLDHFVASFKQLAHKNSNLGYFAVIVRWFIEYSTDQDKKDEFIDDKLDECTKTLLYLTKNPAEEAKLKDQIKSKWSFKDFEDYQQNVKDKIDADEKEKLKNFKGEDKGYELIQIQSFEQLEDLVGGDWTGGTDPDKYHLCYANSENFYYDYWHGGINAFFLLLKDGWKDIKAEDFTGTETAYDDYGTSVICIIVNIVTLKLQYANLRWNHAKEPERKGTDVDHAFLNWGELAETIGRDVSGEIKDLLEEKRYKIEIEKKQVIKNFEKRLKEINVIDCNLVTGGEADRDSSYLKTLKTIVIPGNVKRIEEWGFAELRGAELESLVLQDGVEEISNEAFANISIEKLVIPASVKRIESKLFGSDENTIESIEIDEKNPYYYSKSNGVECNVIVSKNDDVLIFGCCNSKIPDGVKKISNNAFKYVTMDEIVVPDSVTYIGNYAFSDSTIGKIKLPKNAEYGLFAFANSTLEIPTIYRKNKLVIVGSKEKADKYFEVRPGTKEICDYAFSDFSCQLEEIELPPTLETIGKQAFFSCWFLRSIDLPKRLKTIGERAFSACSSLKSIEIPNGVKSIGPYAFCGCDRLERAVIPDSIENFGDRIFYDCTELKEIVCSQNMERFLRSSAVNLGANKDKIDFIHLLEESRIDETTDYFKEVLDSPTTIDGQKDEKPEIGKMYYSEKYNFGWKISADEIKHKKVEQIHVFEPYVLGGTEDKRYGWREFIISQDHTKMKEVSSKYFWTKEQANSAFMKFLKG